MLLDKQSSAESYAQELPRLHKSTVAEAAVLCASAPTTVVYPLHVSLSGVTNIRKHEVASCPITRVSQDAFYAARGVAYVPSKGAATVGWFLESEEKELTAAALNHPPVCSSLKPRSMAVTVLVAAKCQFTIQILDAVAHLASSRCAKTSNLMCEPTSNGGEGFRASTTSEAARSTRMGFLVGPDADAYLKARRVAFEATRSPLPCIGEYGASLVVTYTIKTSANDVYLHASSKELTESYSRCNNNTDSFANEIQRVIAKVVNDAGLLPQSELFQPLPKSTTSPFMDHVASIHNEFFDMLRAPPEVRRYEAEEEETRSAPLPTLRATDVYVRFVPKNLRCTNPISADTCFHGLLLCYSDKIAQLVEYLREARQADRNPIFGISSPNDSRQEAIGIHVMVIQAHAVAMEDNVTSYGLLGSPGKRMHRDGNYVMRTYRQLLALTPQILDQHFLLPCTFQSCIPLKEDVGYAFFRALDDCYVTFATHFGEEDERQVPVKSIARPSTWEFQQQGTEEASITRAIGLGFGSPAMRIGQLVAYLQSSPSGCDDNNNKTCHDALVALLLSALSTLGPQASVVEAFTMAKHVVDQRDAHLQKAEERVLLLESEIERLKESHAMRRDDAIIDTTTTTATRLNRTQSAQETPAADDWCDVAPLSLPTEARDKLMAALGLQKGVGGVSISTPVGVNGNTVSIATKIAKLVTMALNIQSVRRDVMERCKTASASVGNDATTQMRIEAVSRQIVPITTDIEMYVAIVGTPGDRNAHSTAYTTFHHIRRDGGVRKVPLCQVLKSTRLGLVVLNHMTDGDECYWYKLAQQ